MLWKPLLPFHSVKGSFWEPYSNLRLTEFCKKLVLHAFEIGTPLNKSHHIFTQRAVGKLQNHLGKMALTWRKLGNESNNAFHNSILWDIPHASWFYFAVSMAFACPCRNPCLSAQNGNQMLTSYSHRSVVHYSGSCVEFCYYLRANPVLKLNAKCTHCAKAAGCFMVPFHCSCQAFAKTKL